MLNKLIYASIERRPFPKEELAELAQIATTMNRKNEITGYLFYHAGVFFQFLEGPEDPLRQLMSNINRDSRHSIIRQFDLPPSEIRDFPDWGMQVFDLEALARTDLDVELEALMLRLRNAPQLEGTDEAKIIELLQAIAKREYN